MKRDNRPPMTEKEAYKKALKRKTRYRIPSLNPAVLIAASLLAVIIIVCTVVIVSRDGGGKASDTDTAAVTTTDVSEPVGVGITLSREEVHRGDLILVNSDHEFKFPEIPDDVSVYDNKTLSYKVNDKNVTLSMTALTPFNRLMDDFYAETGCRDVMVVSGFRTEEFQRQLYADRVATEGVEAAAKYVALPGQSEHHTGLAMDLSVYTDSGEGYAVRTYEKCKWLVDNFENYGFILRYPEDKAAITGISYESWHYRYVGTPHSLIMKECGWVLEEYVEHLQSLAEGRAILWDGEFSNEGDLESSAEYTAVYYVPAADDADTVITVPEDREYTVSGDNVGGFIITLLPMNGGVTNEYQSDTSSESYR